MCANNSEWGMVTLGSQYVGRVDFRKSGEGCALATPSGEGQLPSTNC